MEYDRTVVYYRRTVWCITEGLCGVLQKDCVVYYRRTVVYYRRTVWCITEGLCGVLQKDCVVVPRAANMYVQPVSSKFIRRWNDLQPLDVQPGEQIRVPPQFLSCGGAPSLHDLQLDQVDQTLFTPVSDPVKAFR